MTRVPIGWSEVKLGDVVKLRGEKRQPSESPSALFVGLENVEAHTSRILKYERAAGMKSAAARFTPGDVLYSRLRPYLNKVFKAEVEGLASAEFLVLKSSPAIEPEYLRRRIMAVDFLDFTAGLDRGDRPRVDYEKISGFDLALPPLAEQRRIVAKLDNLTARTARARSELDHIPRLVEKYKQAILAKAFSGELTKEWRKARSAASAWTSTPLGEVAEISGGKRLPRGHSYSEAETDCPYLRVTDFKLGTVQTQDLKYLKAETAAALSRYQIFSGDLYISIAGSIGLVGRIPKAVTGGVLTENAARIKLGSQITERFAYYYLMSPSAREQIVEKTVATAMAKLALFRIARIAVPLPSVAEQEAVSNAIETAFTWLDKVNAEHSHASHLIPKLDQSILAKAFRGELVPQDPNDETASVLLGRVKASDSQSARAGSNKTRRAAAGSP